MTRFPAGFVALIGALVLLAGCEVVVPNEFECGGGTTATHADQAVLWDGYSYQWEDLSHRVSFLRAGVSVPGEDGFAHRMGIGGGPWADGSSYRDIPHFANGHTTLDAAASGLVAHYGEAEIGIGPDGRGFSTVDLDLDEIDLPERTDYVVGLRGFCFNTDVPLTEGYAGSYDPYKGWTPQAWGARVSDTQQDGRGLSFLTELRFEAGALDRSDHNEAVPFQQLRGSVQYVVLALDTLGVTRATVAASVYHRSEGEAHSYIPGLPEETLTATMELPVGGTTAFPVLRAWQQVLNEDTDPERRGRYLRAWTSRLDRFDYDGETGAASASMDLYLSHSSFSQEGDLEVEHSGEFDVVVLDDEEAHVDRALTTGRLDALGPVDVPAPLPAPPAE